MADALPRVTDLIPHRPPFLFVDEIVGHEPGKRMVTRRTFRPEEDFYRGHYPGNPITPGVVLCEACYQTGALLIAAGLGEGITGIPVLTRSNNAKFKGMVRPGDTIEVEVSLTERISNAWFMNGTVRSGGKVALRLEFAVSLVEAGAAAG